GGELVRCTCAGTYGTCISSSGFELDILIGSRIRKQRNHTQPRYRCAGPRGAQKAEFPNRDKNCFIEQLLLDLVQQDLAFLAVALGDLLVVPGVNLGVFNKRLRPFAGGKGIEACSGVAKSATPLERQVSE